MAPSLTIQALRQLTVMRSPMRKFIARSINQFDQFIHSQSVCVVALAVAALLALVVSNSPWREGYERFLQIPGESRLGANWLVLSKPVLVWVNDPWMAVFFFLVGLEIKRERLEGHVRLRQCRRVAACRDAGNPDAVSAAGRVARICWSALWRTALLLTREPYKQQGR